MGSSRKIENIGDDVILAEDYDAHRKVVIAVIYRPDVVKVYRYLRDHGKATGAEIAEACFPLTFGRSDPLFKRLFKKSMSKTLLSIYWLRGQGVAITCLSTPGDLSKFSLGSIPQGVEAIATYKRSIVSLEAEEGRDAMEIWHPEA